MEDGHQRGGSLKVFFAVPSYAGLRSKPFLDALAATVKLVEERGHSAALGRYEGSCYIQQARNELVKIFWDSDCDQIFFLDDDIHWQAEDALRLIEMPDEIACGVYRRKCQHEDYPVVIYTDPNGRPVVRTDGAIMATDVPAGFLRIRRSAIEKLRHAYPQNAYMNAEDGRLVEGLFDFFPQGVQAHRWWGEDFAFCRLWRAIMGDIWVVPDMWLDHYRGEQCFRGNYHEFLLKQPGGSKGPKVPIARAMETPGLGMYLDDLIWLGEQAEKHTRIVEIGSHLGRSTRCLGDCTSGIVYAVDDWYGPRDQAIPEEQRAKIFASFQSHTGDLIESGRVIPCKGDHSTPPEIELPDMVFIDGDHAYGNVSRDIRYWLDRLRPGGLICGHDADLPGVQQALSELLPQAQVAPNTNIWFFTKGLPQ